MTSDRNKISQPPIIRCEKFQRVQSVYVDDIKEALPAEKWTGQEWLGFSALYASIAVQYLYYVQHGTKAYYIQNSVIALVYDQQQQQSSTSDSNLYYIQDKFRFYDIIGQICWELNSKGVICSKANVYKELQEIVQKITKHEKIPGLNLGLTFRHQVKDADSNLVAFKTNPFKFGNVAECILSVKAGELLQQLNKNTNRQMENVMFRGIDSVRRFMFTNCMQTAVVVENQRNYKYLPAGYKTGLKHSQLQLGDYQGAPLAFGTKNAEMIVVEFYQDQYDINAYVLDYENHLYRSQPCMNQVAFNDGGQQNIQWKSVQQQPDSLPQKKKQRIDAGCLEQIVQQFKEDELGQSFSVATATAQDPNKQPINRSQEMNEDPVADTPSCSQAAINFKPSHDKMFQEQVHPLASEGLRLPVPKRDRFGQFLQQQTKQTTQKQQAINTIDNSQLLNVVAQLWLQGQLSNSRANLVSSVVNLKQQQEQQQQDLAKLQQLEYQQLLQQYYTDFSQSQTSPNKSFQGADGVLSLLSTKQVQVNERNAEPNKFSNNSQDSTNNPKLEDYILFMKKALNGVQVEETGETVHLKPSSESHQKEESTVCQSELNSNHQQQAQINQGQLNISNFVQNLQNAQASGLQQNSQSVNLETLFQLGFSLDQIRAFTQQSNAMQVSDDLVKSIIEKSSNKQVLDSLNTQPTTPNNMQTINTQLLSAQNIPNIQSMISAIQQQDQLQLFGHLLQLKVSEFGEVPQPPQEVLKSGQSVL